MQDEHALIRWRNAIFALFLVNGIISATWAARLPAIQEDTGATLQVMGIALLGGAIGAIVGLSIGPLLMHRLGAKRALGVGFAGMLTGFLAIGIAATVLGSIWAVAAGALLWGLSLGSTDVVTNIEAAANEREIGKTLMPLMHAFYSIGTVIGALAGSAAAAAHWPVLLNIVGVIAVSIAVLLWALPGVPHRPDLDADGERRPVSDRLADSRRAWRDPLVLLIGAGVLANAFAEGGANDWMAIGAVDGHGLSQANGALLFGVFVAGMTLLRLLGGPIVDRFGRVAVLRGSALVGLVGVGIFVWTDGFWMLALGCALWGAGVALGFPLGMSAAADHPNGPARVSVVSTLGYGAFLIGPPVLGFLGQHMGILSALSVLIGLLAIAALVAPAAREQSGPRARTT